jgi:hypothetical protein
LRPREVAVKDKQLNKCSGINLAKTQKAMQRNISQTSAQEEGICRKEWQPVGD